MSSRNDESEDVLVIIDGKTFPNIQKNELDEISLTAFLLGVIFGVSLITLSLSPFWNFNIYMISLSIFHLLEFWITAKYNPGKLNTNSFLINNGVGYFLAHSVALMETIIERLLFPSFKSTTYSFYNEFIVTVGIVLLLLGQYVRSSAMITAGQSFSHVVKVTKNSDHTLVTSGIYSKSRHPSYFGFFWWSVGSQLMLLNPVSLVIFIVVLWKFFNSRIAFEERYLVQFFGNQYITYRETVGVGIPFIK
ncbi:Ste14 [Kluyveromyces lactis]|nr:Ste14 [Kluyveromyces lactis]